MGDRVSVPGFFQAWATGAEEGCNYGQAVREFPNSDFAAYAGKLEPSSGIESEEVVQVLGFKGRSRRPAVELVL